MSLTTCIKVLATSLIAQRQLLTEESSHSPPFNRAANDVGIHSKEKKIPPKGRS